MYEKYNKGQLKLVYEEYNDGKSRGKYIMCEHFICKRIIKYGWMYTRVQHCIVLTQKYAFYITKLIILLPESFINNCSDDSSSVLCVQLYVSSFSFTVASLLNVPGQTGLRMLFSRRTHLQFSYTTLLCILPVYFLFACWSSGSAVASGIVVPMLYV